MAHTIKNISVMNGEQAGVTSINSVAVFFPEWNQDGRLMDGDVSIQDDCAVIQMSSIPDVSSDRVMGRFPKTKAPVVIELMRWFLQYEHAGLYYMATPCEIRAYRRVLGQSGMLVSELALHFVYDRDAGTYVSVMNSPKAANLNYLRRINPKAAPGKALKSRNFLGLFYTLEAYSGNADRGRTLPKFEVAGQHSQFAEFTAIASWDGWSVRHEALYQEYPTGKPEIDALFESLEELVQQHREMRSGRPSKDFHENQTRITGHATAIYRALTSMNPWFSRMREEQVIEHIRKEYGEFVKV